MTGKIIKQISNQYTVLSDDKEYICKPRGKFRNDKETPVVGDIVDINDDLIITKIHKRTNLLTRPVIANVDQAIIITSVKEPKLDLNLLDKLLISIISSKVEAIICFTKLDLIEDKTELNEIINYYKLYFKVINKENKEEIYKILNNKVTVLAGQSGSGKSTFINELTGLDIKTSPISKALGRGKHTTRHVELIKIKDGLLADTPGFSSLDISKIDDIKYCYPEFNKYMNLCGYSDCNHINEKKCAIKDKVNEKVILQSRYDNYLKFKK